jgi:hypothetical protein
MKVIATILVLTLAGFIAYWSIVLIRQYLAQKKLIRDVKSVLNDPDYPEDREKRRNGSKTARKLDLDKNKLLKAVLIGSAVVAYMIFRKRK